MTQIEKHFDEQEGLEALTIFLVKNIKTAENIDSIRLCGLRFMIWVPCGSEPDIGASILKRSLILTCLFPLKSAEEKYVPGSYLQHGLPRSHKS